MESKTSVSSSPKTPAPVGVHPSVMHRRQMLRQVWLPLAGSLIVFLALVILTIVGAAQGSPLIEKLGNVSAIYVIIPVLGAGMVVLALLGGSVYGMRKLLGVMPRWMTKAQSVVASVAEKIQKGADAVTRPIFAANTFAARVRAFRNQIFHR
jgi:hypothetical protein